MIMQSTVQEFEPEREEPEPYRGYLLGLGILIREAERMDAEGVDWRDVIGADLPDEIINHRVRLIFASGKFASHWYESELSVGALIWLTRQRAKLPKDARGICLSRVRYFYEENRRARKADKCSALYGMSLDADGFPRRDAINATHFVIAFSSASDGKSTGTLSRESYKGPPVPLNVLDYLGEDKSRAYQRLRVGISADGSELTLSFEPQQRTRYLVIFVRPLEGELLEALIERRLFKEFGRAVEQQVLGVTGTDSSCFEAVRVGYLPIEPKYGVEPYHELLGPRRLFDPVPLAEQILRDNPPRERKQFNGEVRDSGVPARLKNSLEGVLLASLIAEQFGELVRRENNCEPLVLHRCPFAEEHGSNRGQADGSAYVYDASDTCRFPIMRCHHQTCAGRRTEDFVAEMIAAGEIEHGAVFEDSAYRLRYADDESESRYEAQVQQLAAKMRAHLQTRRS